MFGGLASVILTSISVCLPVSLSVCLPVCLSVCPPACLPVCPSAHLSLLTCLFVWLSTCRFFSSPFRGPVIGVSQKNPFVLICSHSSFLSHVLQATVTQVPQFSLLLVRRYFKVQSAVCAPDLWTCQPFISCVNIHFIKCK